MSDCITCDLVARRDVGKAPLWDCIERTPHWDVVHCNATDLLGWLILVSRRHIASLDEMSEAQAAELGGLIWKVSRILKDVTGCAKTYVVQFAEAQGHAHVHVHIIPRAIDLPEDERGPKIFSHLGVPEAGRVSEAAMNEFAGEVKRRF